MNEKDSGAGGIRGAGCGERVSGNSGGASADGVGDCGWRVAVAAGGLDRRGDSMMKKPFELGADVERALDEIICINDDLPAEYLKEVERRREENDDRSREGAV